MSQNKKSIWSIIILVATIVTLVLLVASIVTTSVALPGVMEEAKQAAISGGATQEEATLAVAIATAAVVVAMVFASIFDLLKIIGGFMFSLKGRWGIFCIVVSILSLASSIWGIVSNVTNGTGTASLVITIISLVVDLVLVVACFKHYQEVR